MAVLTLDYPPSANRIWRNVAGKTLKSREYRDWLCGALFSITAATRGRSPAHRIVGKFRVAIVAERPDRRKRDLDNLAKPILDALKASAIIEDDHLAEEITLTWSEREPAKPAAVHVSVVAA